MSSQTGWTESRLDEITDRGSGHTPNQSRQDYWDGDVDWVSLADSSKLDNGYITTTTRRITPLGIAGSSAVLHPAETVILSRDAGVGKSAVLQKPMAVSQHFIAWECTAKNTLDPWFLYYWLQAKKPYFERMAVGSTIKTIGLQLFRRLTIAYPPLYEQRKIAEILRTWDDAIESNVRLVASTNARFGLLRSELISGVTSREFGFEIKRLNEIATRINRKNDGIAHPVMTISAKSGFVLQSDKYNRDMAGASLANYTLLQRGEFAYNKGNSLTYPQGCVFSMPHDSALVPNVYISFAIDEGLNRRYFEHVFASGVLNGQLARVINSGVRNDGLLNLNADDFFKCEVPVPPMRQQELIANALDEAQREVDLLVAIGNKLRTQKRGLMQKLLTGEIRVTGGDSVSLGEASNG